MAEVAGEGKGAATPEMPRPASSSIFFSSRRFSLVFGSRCGGKAPNSMPSNFSSLRRLTTVGKGMGLSAYPPQMYAQVPTEIFFFPMIASLG